MSISEISIYKRGHIWIAVFHFVMEHLDNRKPHGLVCRWAAEHHCSSGPGKIISQGRSIRQWHQPAEQLRQQRRPLRLCMERRNRNGTVSQCPSPTR